MIRLTDREKRLLQVLAAVIVVLVIYFFIVSPIIEYSESSDTEQKGNLERLEQIERIHSEYKKVRQKKVKYEAQLNKKGENVTSLVEQWSNSSNIAKNIAYTRSTQSKIQNKYVRVTTDVKFESVSIQKLLRFIYEVENSNKLLKLGYIRIHQGLKGSDTYDVIIKIDSFTAQ